MSISVGGDQAQYAFSLGSNGSIVITDKTDGQVVHTAQFNEAISFADGSVLKVFQLWDVGGLIPYVEVQSGAANFTWTGSEPIEIYGLEADDTFQGGSGNDLFDGRAGTDTVIVSGNQADYQFGLSGFFSNLNTSALADDSDERDVYRGIEKFQFADGAITVQETTATLEGNLFVFAEKPAITTLADGTQVIVWKQKNGVLLKHYNGTELLHEEVLSASLTAVQPVVAALEGGGFSVSWAVNEDVSSWLYTQVFNENDGIVSSHLYQLDGADRADLSTVALANGGYAVAWTQDARSGAAPDGVFVQRFDANGLPMGAPVALTAGSVTGAHSGVAALKNGGFVTVWENTDTKGNEEIYLQRFTAAGVKDGKAVQVNTGTTGDQARPDVVTLADGSFVVSWTRESSQSNIFMQRYSETGTKLGVETQVNTTIGVYGESSVTALTSGGYVVTWASAEGTAAATNNTTVYAQMFDRTGAPVGSELVVAKSSYQDLYPQVTATEEGGFTIVWEGYGILSQDDGDILYKVFDANGNFRTLTGDDGNNTLNWSGTTGVTLDGGTGDDTLNGADAADLLIGGVGVDAMAGGKGSDVYDVDDAGDVVVELANEGIDTIRASVSYTLGANLENLTLTGSSHISGVGNALANTVIGNSGDNFLDGQEGADVLIGGAGNDSYAVDDPKDTLVEKAGEGVDLVQSNITWTLGANFENLVLRGFAAINGTGNGLNNTLIGNLNKNTLNGGDGDDTLDGGAGADVLIGGRGSDTYYVDLALKGAGAKAVVALEDTVTEAANAGDSDTLVLRGEWITDSITTLTLGATLENFDVAFTGATRLNLTGNAQANTLTGNAADNVLNGGAGVDTLIGGDGNDTYVVDNAAELGLIQEQAGEGTDTLRVTYKGGATTPQATVNLGLGNLVNIERVEVTGSGLYTLVGNDLDNTLDAGKTASLMLGGKGDDTYYVAHKDAQVVEVDAQGDDGNDTVVASVSFALGDNIERLILTGKAAINGTGNALDNQIIGNDGANVLDGGAGADTLVGGKGNDTYIVDDADDTVSESAGEGADLIKASISFDLSGVLNVENLTLTGSDYINATGNEAANTLTGNSGHNILDGGAGVDKLLGGAGNDTYIVDLVAKGSGAKATVVLQDTIVEKNGEGSSDTLVLRADSDLSTALSGATKATNLTLANYLEYIDASGTGTLKLNLTGNAADNVIVGNHAGNVLNGGGGHDIIVGGDGDDIIIGGLGTDRLVGGAGADSFTFTSLKELGSGDAEDVIVDFVSGEDTLNFKALKGWTFNASATEATGTKQLWAESFGGDTYVYGNSGGGLEADFQIKLTGVTAPLTGADFVLA